MKHRIGVIGGSGLYQLDGLEDVHERVVETPFGAPSDVLLCGRLGDAELVFLPRHGRTHHLLPHEVPYRANLWALKSLGVDWVLSVNAVGSLREELKPGHLVLVDQIIDKTHRRESTFFGKGCVAHVSFAEPTCAALRGYLLQAGRAVGATIHASGTYVAMEGPAFSTRAESLLHRAWGADLIGMTAMPEAKLAREAELSYANLALVTDFDCWREGEEAVHVDGVMGVLRDNADLARRVVAAVVPLLAAHAGETPHFRALDTGLMTPLDAIPAQTRAELAPLLARLLQ